MPDYIIIYVSFYQVPFVLVNSFLKITYFLITIQTLESVNTNIRFYVDIVILIMDYFLYCF